MSSQLIPSNSFLNNFFKTNESSSENDKMETPRKINTIPIEFSHPNLSIYLLFQIFGTFSKFKVGFILF